MRTPNSSSSTELPLAALQHAASKRQLKQRLLMNLIVFVLLIIPVCIYEFLTEPVQRGFFCDDVSIRYPMQRSTISIRMIILLLALVPMSVFVVVELLRAFARCKDAERKVVLSGGLRMRSWLIEVGRQLVYYNFGLLLVLDATEVGKFTMGRLRPHFMAVCQPEFDDNNSTCDDASNLRRYIVDYHCVSTGYLPTDLRQARLSFPSGHASLSFYAAIYLVFYLQRRLTWRSAGFARQAAQFTFVALAWYVALTRITDHWHHWSDVAVGMLLGIIGGLITVFYIVKPTCKRAPLDMLNMGGGKLRRQDTVETLHEHCSNGNTLATCNVNDLIDKQFCTKV